MTRRNDLNDKHDEWEFARLNNAWVGTTLHRILWIEIIRVGIFWVEIILGGNFPAGSCLGGDFPWWGFCGWELSSGNHLGEIFLNGNFPSILLN